MTGDACRLDDEQRGVVERQIAETCNYRGWHLHAVNCRSNHLHVVVTASQAPKIVRNQLKAWCTRRLKELEVRRQQARRETWGTLTQDGSQGPCEVAIRENWWAERGSQRFINNEDNLEAAILYVRDGQGKDKPPAH
jgi:REP element-mobilizing transposase RayT